MSDRNGKIFCTSIASLSHISKKTILFGLTGTGYFDMTAYQQYNDGTMTDYIPTDEDLKEGFKYIPEFPGNEVE